MRCKRDDLADGPLKSIFTLTEQGTVEVNTLFKFKVEISLDLMSDNMLSS